jgi:PleD family two-component response regulator
MHVPQQTDGTAATIREAKKTMNILIVDDSEDHCELTEAVLHSAGYKSVQHSLSANDAFKLLGIGRNTGDPAAIDIILLDVVMPEMDGIEACAYIRNDQRYEDVPIIMVTSLDDMESLSNAFIAGANDYVTKPVNRIELLARVRAALKLKGELEQRRARERELLNFLSSWGDRRATLWIDEPTGLFVGEVAEAYLTAETRVPESELVSVIALAIDRLDSIQSSQGDKAVHAIQVVVARAVRATTSTIGVIAASYRNGIMIIVAPEYGAASAQKLAQTLRGAIAALRIGNRELVVADHITASAAVVTGRAKGGAERASLLMQAIANVQRTTADGGDRLMTIVA